MIIASTPRTAVFCMLITLFLTFAASQSVFGLGIGTGPVLDSNTQQYNPEDKVKLGFEVRGYRSKHGGFIPGGWEQAFSGTVLSPGVKYDSLDRKVHGTRPDFLLINLVDMSRQPNARERARIPPGTGKTFPDGGSNCVHFDFSSRLHDAPAREGATAWKREKGDGMALYRNPAYALKPYHDYKLRGKIRVRVSPKARLADDHAPRGGARLAVTYLYRDPKWIEGVYNRWEPTKSDPEVYKFLPVSHWDVKANRLMRDRPAALPSRAMDISNSVPMVPGDSGWQEVEMRLHPPPGATHMRVICEAVGTEAKADVWFDDIDILVRPTIRVRTWKDALLAQNPRLAAVFGPSEVPSATVSIYGLGQPRQGEYTAAFYLSSTLDPSRRYYLTTQGTFSSKRVIWQVATNEQSRGVVHYDISLPTGSVPELSNYGSFWLTVELWQHGLPSTISTTRITHLPPVERLSETLDITQGIGLQMLQHGWTLEQYRWALEILHSRWLVIPMWKKDLLRDSGITGDDPLYRILLKLKHHQISSRTIQIDAGFYPLPDWLKKAVNDRRLEKNEKAKLVETLVDILQGDKGDIDLWKKAVHSVVEQYGPVVKDFHLAGTNTAYGSGALAMFRTDVRTNARGPFTFTVPWGLKRPEELKPLDRLGRLLPDGDEAALDVALAQMPAGERGDLLQLWLPLRRTATPDKSVTQLRASADMEYRRVAYLWKSVLLGMQRGYKRFLIMEADHRGSDNPHAKGAGARGLIGLDASGGFSKTGDAYAIRLAPDQAMVAARVLNSMLAGTKPAHGGLFLPGVQDVSNRVFFKKVMRPNGQMMEEAVLVYWAEKPDDYWKTGGRIPFEVLINLLPEARITDLFGNETAVTARRLSAGRVALTAGRLPYFLTGLDASFMRVLLDVGVTRRIESRWQEQGVSVSVPNRWNEARRFEVTMQIVDDKDEPLTGWKIRPGKLQSHEKVQSGDFERFTFYVRPPMYHPVGAVSMRLNVKTITPVADASTRSFDLRRPLEVDSSIILKVNSWVGPLIFRGQQVIGVDLSAGWHAPSDATRAISIKAYVGVPGHREVWRNITGIRNEPGYTASTRGGSREGWLYVPVPNGWENGPLEIQLRAREKDGSRTRREIIRLDKEKRHTIEE